MAPTVTITEHGRSGHVTYAEGLRSIRGYWEFGGNDVVTIVNMGTRADWERSCAWAVYRRAEILRLVAGEVVRQRAPTCVAEIDEARGDILLRRGAGAAPSLGGTAHRAMTAASPQARAEAFVKRYATLKAMFGVGLLVAALIAAGLLWMGKRTLMVQPASGVPLNECVRTDTHIASLVQSTDPHLPEISGRGGNTTSSISILLIPLDGSAVKKIDIAEGLSNDQYALAKILGSDGRVLWFDVNGIGGVDLQRETLLEPAEVRDPFVPGSGSPLPPDPERFLSAGFITSAGQWLGLHSEEELTVAFAPKKFVRRVESQQSRKQMRRFVRGTLDAAVDGKYHRIMAMEPISDSAYLNAAFLRMDDGSEPLRPSDPDGALMIHTDKPGIGGKLIVSRVDEKGAVLWWKDTGIDRFQLTQILPGTDAFAFVGTRPPVEGKVSEPLVVLVDNSSGKMTSHSLWR